MKKIYLAGLAIALVSCSAMARSPYKQPFKGGNDDLFITASIANSSHQIQVDDEDGLFNNKADELSLGLNFDYRLGKYFSVGAGYVNFGEAEQLSETDTFGGDTENFTFSTAGSGFSASVMLHTNIKEGPWFFFVRWGRLSWDVELIGEVTVSGTQNFSAQYSETNSGNDKFSSYGAAYHINEKVRVGLTFEHYDMDYRVIDPDDNFITDYSHQFKQTALSVTYSF